MKLPRIATLVLLLFVTGLLSVTAGEVWHALAGAEHLIHPEGSPCPDPGDDGGPCGPSCPCACCPGHVPAAFFAPVSPSIEAPPSCVLYVSFRDDLHPVEVIHRIFHPPRT